MKKIFVLKLMCALLCSVALSCSGAGSGTVDNLKQYSGRSSKIISAAYDTQGSNLKNPFISSIELKGNSIVYSGSGAVIDGNKIAITSAGTYSISGTLEDGQIIVKTDDEGSVNLILNGVKITCSASSPIYINNAKEAVITLADGTDNYITDGDA